MRASIFSTIVIVFTLACVGGAVPVAQTPINWQEAGDRWSLHIVTLDPDGDERVTRIWLAIEGDVGTLRTGDSRWWQNLERAPDCRIRLGRTDYPMRVVPVTQHEERARIDDAFENKYGWLDRIMFRQDRGETHENYARFRGGEAP